MSDVSADVITNLNGQQAPAQTGAFSSDFWKTLRWKSPSRVPKRPYARASNISIGGIGFLTRESLMAGSRVTVVAHFADSPSVTLVADVVHSVESDGIWEHGAIFHSEPSIELVYHICEAYELRRLCK